MGDVSIIARRLKDGHVQYGWSGNGGTFRTVGARLLAWYQDPKDVEYLFDLGQTALIGKKGSEYGGYPYLQTHMPTGESFWIGDTERRIFSKIAFVDFGYFYDTDCRWYYIIPGPFRVKIPLELVAKNLNENRREDDYLQNVRKKIIEYIFGEYKLNNPGFADYLEERGYDAESILTELKAAAFGLYTMFEEYNPIFRYFDDWIVIKSDIECKKMNEIIVKKAESVHTETCFW